MVHTFQLKIIYILAYLCLSIQLLRQDFFLTNPRVIESFAKPFERNMHIQGEKWKASTLYAASCSSYFQLNIGPMARLNSHFK
jgi:hypothetical protein